MNFREKAEHNQMMETIPELMATIKLLEAKVELLGKPVVKRQYNKKVKTQ